MPVTLTVGELAVALRVEIEPMAPVRAPYAGIPTRALDAATEHIDQYAGDSTPDAVLNEAAVRMAGFLMDAPSFTRTPALAFRNSGCQSLLAPWHVPRSVTV